MNDLYELNTLKGIDIFAILREHKDSIDDYFWQYYKNMTSELIEEYVRDICYFSKPSGNLLSIGCGHGINEILIADMCKEVETIFGLDIIDVKIRSMNEIINILNFKNIKGVLGDGTKVGFPNEYFDTVILIESLSHVNDQFQPLNEALRVLKKQGRIFVLDFNNGANPRILYRCWKENRLKGVIDENPVNPYFIRNRLQNIGVNNIIIQPYRFSTFFNKLGGKLGTKAPYIPTWFQLLMTTGFMLKGEK